jgi:hypothetical protein
MWTKSIRYPGKETSHLHPNGSTQLESSSLLHDDGNNHIPNQYLEKLITMEKVQDNYHVHDNTPSSKTFRLSLNDLC